MRCRLRTLKEFNFALKNRSAERRSYKDDCLLYNCNLHAPGRAGVAGEAEDVDEENRIASSPGALGVVGCSRLRLFCSISSTYASEAGE